MSEILIALEIGDRWFPEGMEDATAGDLMAMWLLLCLWCGAMMGLEQLWKWWRKNDS